MERVQENLANHPSNLMLWEGEPSGELTSSLLELGVKSIVFNPCGNMPSEGDFISVMNNNIAQPNSFVGD